ncbi:nucleoside ABC transporter membrane protein [Archaeoglobus sulfaticallidus PM70-1]|uniref:Nucleoside ABC transporter membrane protein n=1 Tax=Archaeoglobus sulfaticallidus PM70-1 TaxID=387631 RepID=N0BNZ4_9EURY|nr:ABC transporter permease [Archaeoglobus sulfaticallidus]AGK62055.1 nucleoside ABC transporter membrane protein [Archaeoglobus sulfaticallidus PM70-1]
MIEVEFLASLIAASMRAGTPLLFATLGEIITERSGVLNLGLEGIMIMGAMTGFYVSLVTGNPWLGILIGGLAGLLLAIIHAFFTVTLKVDQAVTGLMLVLLGLGLTGFLGKDFVGTVAEYITPMEIPYLSDIPYLGTALFSHDPFVYLGIALVPVIWFIMNKTRYGMELFAVGENPEAADTMGIPVDRVRFIAVLIGGFLVGVAGAYLSLAYAKVWTEGLTAGRGWICLALVIFSGWTPHRAIFGAYLFGGLDVLSFKLQALGLGVSYHFMRMVPYVFTILVLLVGVIREKEKFGAPSALGKPYIREQKY